MSGIVKSCLAAIEDGSANRFDSAVLRACIALDASSQAHFTTKKSTKTQFKNFVREYYWLLQMMQGGGVDLEKTRFDNAALTSNGKAIVNPDFADVIYHAYRCDLVHEGDFRSGFDVSLSSANSAEWLIADNMLVMPSRILWGLVAVCVFAKSNSDLTSSSGHNLTWTANSFGRPTFTFILQESWGQEDKLRELLKQYPLGPIVELKGLDFKQQPALPTQSPL